MNLQKKSLLQNDGLADDMNKLKTELLSDMG